MCPHHRVIADGISHDRRRAHWSREGPRSDLTGVVMKWEILPSETDVHTENPR